jgi:ketosteroid isomerase-like protein
MSTESTSASESRDPVVVVSALDAACNAGDIERVMAFFADNAILKDPMESKVLTGKQQIREWFQLQMGHFHVTSTNHRVTGNTVTWHGTLTGDIVQQMGRDTLEETAEAFVQGGKITSFALTIV